MLPTTSSWEIPRVWRERPTIRSEGPSICFPLSDYESTFFIRLFTFFKLFVSIFWSGKFHETIHTFCLKCISVFGKFHKTSLTFHHKCILVFGKFQHISVFRSLGNFIRLFTLFIVSVFRSLGNFMRLVTLFVISLNCTQFMWESFEMATFSCFPLQVHGKFHEYGGKGLQLDQWAPPFVSH